MIFYSDLVKKVKEGKFEKNKDIYIFKLDFLRVLKTLAMATPFILIGAIEVITIQQFGFRWQSLLSFIAVIYGLYLIFTALSFKITVKENSLTLKKTVVNFDEVVTCTLENRVVPKGKAVEPSLKFVTKNNEEIYFHLFMGKRLEFLLLIKEILGSRFKIVEDK